MSERIQALAQHLLQKSSVEDCSLEELQHLTKRYPFFAPAQFLLLQKLKDTGSPEAAAQQRKAVLYFHDPLQIDHFLSADAYAMDDVFAENEIVEDDYSSAATLETPEFTADSELPVIETGEMEEVEQPGLPITETEAPAEVETIPVFSDPDIITETTIEPPNEPAVLPVEPLPEEQPVVTLPQEETQSTSGPVAESSIEQAPVEKTQDVIQESSEISPSPLAKDEAPTPSGSETLFEPFHTVDYFASQGIKITATELPKDKLSKQLRSFTEWLKVMKRLPAAEMAGSPQSTAEKTVVNMATHSVEGSEVVTEAMAEVWAKQGAREKAIETYNKLSLLNPSKKAYFAAKIENLKGS
jgi:hypothetical protein